MIYVFIQFSCIFVLIANTQFKTFYFIDIFFLLLAILIGLRAVYIMKIANLNILPDLKTNHQLRIEDIYRFIRHPMYSSVILLCFALFLNHINFLSIIVFTILVFDLYFKARYEEEKLLEEFSEYKEYKKQTSMFFPF